MVKLEKNNGKKSTLKRHTFKKLVIEKHPGNSIFIFDNPVFRIVGDPSVDASSYLRLSLNSFLYDDGEFANQNSPSDRWEHLSKRLNLSCKPYRKNGNHIVLVMQKLFDASLRGVEKDRAINHIKWLNKAISDIRQNSDRKIEIRPHPLSWKSDAEKNILNALDFQKYKNVEFNPTSSRDIRSSLKDAWACVTYCSGSAVISLLEGVPVVAYDSGSMASPVASKTAVNINNIKLYDREQWLYDMAYTQWNSEELRSGKPWLRFKPYLVKSSKY